MKTTLNAIMFIIFTPMVYANETYIARGNVYIREAPPKPPFYTNANKLGVVKKDETVTLIDKKNVFFYEWLKIEVVRDKKIVGWVYNGENDGVPYFEKVEVE